MKYKLDPTENNRTFYTNKGTQTIIRDTFTRQFDSPKQQESIEEIKLKIEEVIIDQPFKEINTDKIIKKVIEKNNIKIKNTNNKNERPTKN